MDTQAGNSRLPSDDDVDALSTLTLPVSRAAITLALLLGVLVLAVIHLFGLISIFHLYRSNLYCTIDFFHFDGEANLPSWYASVLLLICSLVLGLIASGKWTSADRFARHWLGLALILLYMSADEGAQFHELWNRPVRDFTDGTDGVFRFAWIIPGAILALMVGLAYIRFLAHLARRFARRFVLAGVVYLGAAIGLESLSGWYLTNHGDDLGYSLIAAGEELVEKLAVILAIDTALAYLACQTPAIRLQLARPANPGAPDY